MSEQAMSSHRVPLSVTIITKDEEQNIAECLQSVRWADEIIVVDAESVDKTREVALQWTPHVIVHAWEGYAQQKAFALSQATHEWVFSIDADERATPELQEEIASVLRNGTSCSGFYIPRKNFFLGKWIRSCGWYPNYQLRLFRREATQLTNRLVHEGFVVKGNVGYLKSAILHNTHPSIERTVKKINEYSTLQAQEKAEGKRIRIIDVLFRPVIAFCQHFFLRRGFTEGFYGFMVSAFHAMTNLLTYMKAWELQHKESKNPQKKSSP
ncbi:MAG: glycosyltransferase family 2 protein [Bacteroidota bacterium]